MVWFVYKLLDQSFLVFCLRLQELPSIVTIHKIFLLGTMGCIISKPDVIEDNNGDGKDFLDRFSVGEILGQGEFGVVKSVYDKNDPAGK